MARRTRRIATYLALVGLTTAVLTLTYNLGMSVWEGRPQPIYRSFEVVVQTFTTTGYGEDAPWMTPQMNLLIVVMQLTGIGLILAAVDVFAVPWLRDALTPSAPTAAPDATDHVVVCEFTPRTEVFLEELESRDEPYVLVEADEETATDLHEAGQPVVHGDPESIAVLERAGVDRARALVADAADDTNASIVLSAREATEELRVVTLAEDEELAEYHRVAGADEVLSPRQLLGESLASRVPTTVTTAVGEGVEIGDDFELVEVAVEEGSDIAGRAFADLEIRERFGVNVVGAWLDGDFETAVAPDTTLEPGTTLLVAGAPDQLAEFGELTASTVRRFTPPDVLVAGYGQTGAAARHALADTSARLTVLDVEEKEGVDVVGDARDPDVLESAGIDDASALLVTVADDTTAVFLTLVARDLNPELDIVVRANERADVGKLYRAGADYVQSLAAVSGRMMATTVFEDEEVLAYDRQIEVVKLPVGELAGQTLVAAEVRDATGCTVLAVERDGEYVTEFDPGTFQFEAGDEVVVAGTDESVSRFEDRFVE